MTLKWCANSNGIQSCEQACDDGTTITIQGQFYRTGGSINAYFDTWSEAHLFMIERLEYEMNETRNRYLLAVNRWSDGQILKDPTKESP